MDAVLFDSATKAETEIDRARSYNLVTNNFVADGGDGYTSIAACPKVFPTGRPLDQIVADRFVAAGNNPGVNPPLEGRIVNCAFACGIATSPYRARCKC